MRGLAILAVFVLGTLSAADGAEAEGDPEAGRKVALQHCSRCHVVSDDPYDGIDSTPSFRLLAKRNDWLERFQTFYERRPHPVFVRVPNVPRWTDLPPHVATFEITLEDIENIVAFVRTLKPK